MELIDMDEVMNSVIMVILFLFPCHFCIYIAITINKQKEDAK